jgi:phage terminase large subunit GpA-like protein
MVFESLEHMQATAFAQLSPEEQLSVVEVAEKYVYIKQPGSYVGYWSRKKAPYLVEPQEVLTSLDFTGMIFLGPARTGKSQMALNHIAHTAKTDPTDYQVVQMSQHKARKWSKSDLAKMLRDSKDIHSLLLPGRQNDNTYDKEFTSGMRLMVNWPTAKNLSGDTIRLNWIMDYDRIEDDIEGEGNAFDLTDKRGESFKRFRMTAAESSPNPDKEIADPKWRGKTPHEAPPIKGIFSLYNRGDRRRWNWECPSCSTAFEPSFKLFNYPKSDDMMEASEMVTLRCPHCSFDMTPDMKEDLNLGGRWIKDGQIWLPKTKEIVPINGMKVARSDIASFWMKGPAAIFQDWDKIVLSYLRAEKEFEDTGDEMPLRKTVTTDQGDYYIPKSRLSERTPEDLKDKANDWGSTEDCPTVPRGVRFLIATIDIQAKSFVVQVHGFTADGDVVLIDFFKLRKSRRLDADNDPLPIDPAAYGEDWDILVDEVMKKTYPVDDDSGRHMQIKITGSDSAGREGFTTQAYAFWRRLKTGGEGLHRRFVLIKGDGSPNAPRTAVSWPDQQHKDKNSPVRGDVPVLRLQSNMLKDTVDVMLARRADENSPESGGGMVRFPSWTPYFIYQQLTTEIRTQKGWINPHSRRNEALDLLYYALAVAIRPPDLATNAPWAVIRWDRIDWDNPPSWAKEWDENDLVIDTKTTSVRLIEPAKPRPSLADLAKQLG